MSIPEKSVNLQTSTHNSEMDDETDDIEMAAADKIKALETVLDFYVQARKLEEPQTDRVWRIMSKWYNTVEDNDFRELVVDEFFNVLGE